MKYDNESQLLGKDADGKLYYREGMDLGEIWGYHTDRYIRKTTLM